MKKINVVLYALLSLNSLVFSDYIIEDFTTSPDPWGSAKWDTETSLNGLSASNPYLLVDAIGLAPKRGVILRTNDSSWTGDYISRGITGIAFDVRNMSDQDSLRLRVAIGDTQNPMSGTWFVSSNFANIQPSSDWSSVFLPINENDLSKASSAMSNGSPGPQNFNQVMSNVFALRIISQGASGNAICEDYIGDTLIDNIQLIPEPNTVGLTVLAGLILIMIKNQKSVLT
jgi:hypothetical protein